MDFPIPGSPPIRVTEPGTNPPPMTLSNSFRLVLYSEYLKFTLFSFSKLIFLPFDLDKTPERFRIIVLNQRIPFITLLTFTNPS